MAVVGTEGVGKAYRLLELRLGEKEEGRDCEHRTLLLLSRFLCTSVVGQKGEDAKI